MEFKYQVIFLGNSPFKQAVIDTLNQHLSELGIELDNVELIPPTEFYEKHKANAPSVAVYFGTGPDFTNIDIVNSLISFGSLIIPVVSDKENFLNLAPPELHAINGYQLGHISEVEALVSCILEGLSLLRTSRRLFISYKRSESTNTAIQLYERLEKAGFNVFLDTHSIRPGEPFQDELWHRLVDTDVVVLLNTKGFLESHWTSEELAKANALSIGILQLVWPEHKLEKMAELSEQIQLNKEDFISEKFNDKTVTLENKVVEIIIQSVESLRARSLAARHDNIATEFIKFAELRHKKASIQPEKFITMDDKDGKEMVLIPTIGIPHGFTYNEKQDLIERMRKHKSSKAWLLYDHRNIRDKWLKHLTWLDGYLPIKSLKVTEIEQWLEKI